jgi:hypothetical protein
MGCSWNPKGHGGRGVAQRPRTDDTHADRASAEGPEGKRRRLASASSFPAGGLIEADRGDLDGPAPRRIVSSSRSGSWRHRLAPGPELLVRSAQATAGAAPRGAAAAGNLVGPGRGGVVVRDGRRPGGARVRSSSCRVLTGGSSGGFQKGSRGAPGRRTAPAAVAANSPRTAAGAAAAGGTSVRAPAPIRCGRRRRRCGGVGRSSYAERREAPPPRLGVPAFRRSRPRKCRRQIRRVTGSPPNRLVAVALRGLRRKTRVGRGAGLADGRARRRGGSGRCGDEAGRRRVHGALGGSRRFEIDP